MLPPDEFDLNVDLLLGRERSGETSCKAGGGRVKVLRQSEIDDRRRSFARSSVEAAGVSGKVGGGMAGSG